MCSAGSMERRWRDTSGVAKQQRKHNILSPSCSSHTHSPTEINLCVSNFAEAGQGLSVFTRELGAMEPSGSAKSRERSLRGSGNAGQAYQTYWRATIPQGGFQITAKFNWTWASGHSSWITWIIRFHINFSAVLVTAKPKALSTSNGHPSNMMLMSVFKGKSKNNYHYQEIVRTWKKSHPFNTSKHNLSEFTRS